MAAGIPAALQRLGQEAIASMRPRPNGRGNVSRWRVAPFDGEASMRPRPNGRGNEARTRKRNCRLLGFNEAAAEWPREY